MPDRPAGANAAPPAGAPTASTANAATHEDSRDIPVFDPASLLRAVANGRPGAPASTDGGAQPGAGGQTQNAAVPVPDPAQSVSALSSAGSAAPSQTAAFTPPAAAAVPTGAAAAQLAELLPAGATIAAQTTGLAAGGAGSTDTGQPGPGDNRHAEAAGRQAVSSDATSTVGIAAPVQAPTAATASTGAQHATGARAGAGSPDQAAVIAQVVRHVETTRLRSGSQEMTVTLRPEHLGDVHVTITRTADGVSARLLADNPHTRQAMEAGREGLRQAMQERGINLTQLDIGSYQSGTHDQSATAQAREALFGSAARSPASVPAVEDAAAHPVTRVTVAAAGRLDYVV